MHSEAVSGHVSIYLVLGVYGQGTCLHSLHIVTIADVVIVVCLSSCSLPCSSVFEFLLSLLLSSLSSLSLLLVVLLVLLSLCLRLWLVAAVVVLVCVWAWDFETCSGSRL